MGFDWGGAAGVEVGLLPLPQENLDRIEDLILVFDLCLHKIFVVVGNVDNEVGRVSPRSC